MKPIYISALFLSLVTCHAAHPAPAVTAGMLLCINTNRYSCELEKLQIRIYEGFASDGTSYVLTLYNPEYSGDGTFTLSTTAPDRETAIYTGQRFTQRGTPEDINATVWQMVSHDGKRIFNLLYERTTTLEILDERFERTGEKLHLKYDFTRHSIPVTP